MDDFLLKYINSDIADEIERLGYDKSYLLRGSKKFQYKNIKIYNLTPAQANILKQTALSVGADCATHRDVISGKIENSDCILGGSISQLKKISQKLLYQPFNLKQLGEQIEKNLFYTLKPFVLKNKKFDFERPYLVGILNLSESFSDGYPKLDDAKKHFEQLVANGADIIDIGAESTKPGANAVADEIQLEKIIPILEFVKNENIPISIDTRSSNVARECLNFGADIINDVSGFDYDEQMVNLIAEYDCPVILQHSSGTPDVMQENTCYENLMDDIYKSLNQKIIKAQEHGISNIIVDPGIGFGKTRYQNIEILKRFDEFYSLNCPIMIGISRKSFLNMFEDSNFEKDIYTLAINAVLMSKDVNFLRVHNVKLHKKLLDTEILK